MATELALQPVADIDELRARLAAWRRAGERIAFVPTMGSLHAGHLSLVETAAGKAQRVVVSIFVNPLQFAAGEDFDRYPRSLEEDCRQLADLPVDLVFAPSEEALYPHGREGVTQVVVPGISDELCGAFREGHFQGVTTVVNLLFNILQPDVAVFGEKDYQQLEVIRRMVRDLHMPVQVLGAPTVREPSGLAMSSRNAYLSAGQREQAGQIYRALRQAADSLEAGEREFGHLERAALSKLEAEGLTPQFFAIRRPDLSSPAADDQEFVILVAARLGKTRLIDNLMVTAPRP